MFKTEAVFNRRQVLCVAGAAVVLAMDFSSKSTFVLEGWQADLGEMVRREYARNLEIVMMGREILRKADGGSEHERVMAVAAVSDLCVGVKRDWYDRWHETKGAMIRDGDPELYIGLIYGAMGMSNSDQPKPRSFGPMMRLFDSMAKYGPSYVKELA